MAEVSSDAVLPGEGDEVAAVWPAPDTLVFLRADTARLTAAWRKAMVVAAVATFRYV